MQVFIFGGLGGHEPLEMLLRPSSAARSARRLELALYNRLRTYMTAVGVP